MVQQKPSSGPWRVASFVRKRLVSIPIMLFFLPVIAQMTMQFKTVYRLMNSKSNIGSDEILQSQLGSHRVLRNTYQYNDPILQYPTIESRKNTSEGNRTVHSNSSAVESNVQADRVHTQQMMSNEYNDTVLQSHNIEPMKNALDENRTVHGDLSTAETNTQMDRIPTLQEMRETMGNDSEDFMTAVNPIKNYPSVEDGKKVKRKTRVIFGIMTYDSTTEQQRRGLIRKTFLSYFKNYMNRTLVTDEEYNKKKHWICSLNDLDHGRLAYPEKCRMAYAFVQGANPNGTSMLLTFNETYPLSLPPPKAKTKDDEMDITDNIYLNIQENGRFGKTPTWFRYAIDVLERHGWMEEWDYVFKSDTDNLIYTPSFFRFMDKLPRKKAVRVFGGKPLDYKKCGGDKHDDCKKMVGPYFMQGGCYFLSIDLVKFISDETTFDHQAVKLGHEDMTTGNFVYSHPESIKIVKEPSVRNVIRYHPLKTDKKFMFRWNKMLRGEQDRLSSWLESQQKIQ